MQTITRCGLKEVHLAYWYRYSPDPRIRKVTMCPGIPCTVISPKPSHVILGSLAREVVSIRFELNGCRKSDLANKDLHRSPPDVTMSLCRALLLARDSGRTSSGASVHLSLLLSLLPFRVVNDEHVTLLLVPPLDNAVCGTGT